jgi:hypothetical protein
MRSTRFALFNHFVLFNRCAPFEGPPILMPELEHKSLSVRVGETGVKAGH